MRKHRLLLSAGLFLVVALAASCGADPQPTPAATPTEDPSELDPIVGRVVEPFLGDLDAIRQRGTLRVLVSYSRTNFFFAGARPAGFEAELMRGFEKHLNRGVRDPLGRIRVVFVPTSYDRLIDDLLAGRGDVIATALSVTFERGLQVAFSDPYLPDVEEVLVHGTEVEGLGTLADLDGRRLLVRADSSYAEHVRRLDEVLRSDGGRGLTLIEADPSLATEDLLELVSAGAVELTFADDYLARAWAPFLGGLVVREDVVLHPGIQIAWAVRPQSPALLAALNEYAATVRRGSKLGNLLFARYYESEERLRNPLDPTTRDRFEAMRSAFRRSGERHGIDWIALAAQGYQESRLDPNRVSPAGAVGVMQLLPTTARELGFDDLRSIDENIEAGATYLAQLRDRYFSKGDIAPENRLDFAWAAYNAGPARIRRLRSEAAEMGLDPDLWFDHVEQVAARRIGRETVDYVRNIVKYYVAYRLYLEGSNQRRDTLRIVHGGGV
mgnify:CR=1 FL=1